MSLFAIHHRGAQSQALAMGGLLLAFCIVAGCSRKAAPAGPVASAASATNAVHLPATNAVVAAQTNLADLYTNSVFEDLPPQKGKDPFFPTSHRRDQKTEVAADTTSSTPSETDFVLKGIIYTSKEKRVVVNNQIFKTGETNLVTLTNGKPVKIWCLKIGTNDAQIQVEGEAEPRTLMMETKKPGVEVRIHVQGQPGPKIQDGEKKN